MSKGAMLSLLCPALRDGRSFVNRKRPVEKQYGTGWRTIKVQRCRVDKHPDFKTHFSLSPSWKGSIISS